MIKKGLSNEEIAEIMDLTTKTVWRIRTNRHCLLNANKPKEPQQNADMECLEKPQNGLFAEIANDLEEIHKTQLQMLTVLNQLKYGWK